MRVLITNAYSARNKGDAAILVGMLADLRSQEAFRGAEFRISTAAFPEDKGNYSCNVVSSFHSLKQQFTRCRWLQCLCFVLFILPSSFAWAAAHRLGRNLWVPCSWRSLFQEYAEADLVVAAGGGYLYTHSMWRGNLMLVITVYSFWFATLLGKPFYLYGQSIGPFAARFQAAMVRFALSYARLVLVREGLSKAFLSRWRLPCPVAMTGDASFLLPRPAEEDVPLNLSYAQTLVGITLREWPNGKEGQRRFEVAIAEFVNWLTRDLAATVVFVPQVTFAAWGDDDRMVMRRVYQGVEDRSRVMLIEDELSVFQVKALCGAVNFFVGMRMHSNIFALSMGVPTLAIGYQPKSEGIMRQLGLERFLITVEEVTLSRLQVLFEALTASAADIRTMLGRQVLASIENARLNGRLIAKDYKLDISVRS